MPKVYRAFYKDEHGTRWRQFFASLTTTEAEAKKESQERDKVVFIDVLEIEKPSMKSVISMMNGAKPLSVTRLCRFEPRVDKKPKRVVTENHPSRK